MTVADLIAELQKLKPYQPVAVALEQHGSVLCDTEGQPFVCNLVADMDCYGVETVKPMGSWVQIIGSGPYFGERG